MSLPTSVPAPFTSAERRALTAALIRWYDRHRRDLPWRAKPGETADPYRVWLSEIMLQQTTVATVAARFDRFLRRWPDLAALAAAPLDDILHEWQGLGYYARARNLHAAARAVVAQHGGRFPADEAALRRLPGVGPYTAAAIAAFAFDLRATPLDANIERVIARLFAVTEPLPAARPLLRDLAATLTPARRPGDYAQGVMDLGATLCTPRRPACALCPWRDQCRAHALGLAEALPRKPAKKAKPQRFGILYWARLPDGAVLLRRRPDTGLLGGMMEFPSTPWQATPWRDAAARRLAPVRARWQPLAGEVRHGFTHFDLALTIWQGRIASVSPGFIAIRPAEFGSLALPTLMTKVADHAGAMTRHLEPAGDRR